MPFYSYGTAVDFGQASVIPNTESVLVGLAGFYGYQPAPATTNVNIDNIGKSLASIMSALAPSLMVVKYAQISWNQTDNTVTDFVFGMAYEARNPVSFADIYAKLPSDFQVLLNQLEMVYGPLDNLTINGFTSYLLYGAVQSNAVYTASIELQSGPYTLDQVGGSVPSDSEIATLFISQGKVDEALAKFVSEMSLKGYTVTLRGYSVTAHAAVAGISNTPPPRPFYRSYITLSFSFTSDKPLPEFMTAKLIAPVVAIIIILIVTFIVANAVDDIINNLTTTKTTIDEVATITNPSNLPVTVKTPQGDVTIPAGGTYTYSITKDLTTPPNWWSWVIPVIALGAFGIVAVFLLPLRPRRSEK